MLYEVTQFRATITFLYVKSKNQPMADEDLAEKVELSGFKDIDESAMEDVRNSIMKKLKRLSEICKGIEKITIQLKKVHAEPRSEKYEIHARLTAAKGKTYTSTMTDYDLILAVGTVLERIESEASKDRVL